MLIKRSSPVYQEPEVSRKIARCTCCNKPLLPSMVKMSENETENIEPQTLCPECVKQESE